MAIQMTRADYEKKYGTQPEVPVKPAPIKMTHSDYVNKYVNPPEQQGGFVSEMGKAIVKPFARFGVTAFKAGAGIGGLGKAGIQYALGDKEGAQETLNVAGEMTSPKAVDLPWLGKVDPYGAAGGKMKDLEGQTRDIVGGGLQIASYATGNPALMGAVQGAGQAVEEDKGLLETAAYTAGGAVAGKVGEVAFKGAGAVISKGGSALKTAGLGGTAVKEAAEASYARVLAPTTKANKALTKRITPELVERKITSMTRKGLLEQAETGVQATGKQLEEAYLALPENAKVAIDPVLDAIGKAKSKLMMTAADGSKFIPPQNESKMKIWQGIQDTITKLTANGQAEISGIREFRQLLDKGTYGKGLVTGSESAVKEVESKGANILRNELAKQFPDIAVINREYNFWRNLRDVTQATIERKTGQAKTGFGGKIAAGAGAVVGGAHGGPIGALEGATAFKWLHAVTTSPGWETVSGATKGRIAELLSKGQTTRAGSLILNIAERLGTNVEKFGGMVGGVPQAIKETPVGEIPGAKQGAELIKEGIKKTKGLPVGLSVKDISKVDGKSIPNILQKMDKEDGKIMTDFIDNIRLKGKQDVNLEIEARRTAEAMGLDPNITNAKLANKFESILNYNFPKKAQASKSYQGFHVTDIENVKNIEKKGFTLEKVGDRGTVAYGDPKGVYFFPSKKQIHPDWMDSVMEGDMKIIKRDLKVDKPYIVKSESKYFEDVVKPATGTKTKSWEQWREELMDSGDETQSDKVTEFLKKKGYDAVIDTEGLLSNEESQIIMLDLGKITKEAKKAKVKSFKK